MKKIQIFRPGKFKAMNGQEVSFSADMLEDIARSYDPALHKSPIVIGHPKLDDPAWGWIKSLAFSGGILTAMPETIVQEFAAVVAAGHYKKVSASFFTPDSAGNPTPGKHYLKHVGFLGAVPPAVTGLQPVSFAADEKTICIEFSAEGYEPGGEGTTEKEEYLNKEQLALDAKRKEQDEREKRLNAKEKGLKRVEFSTFIDGLKKEGKVLPAFENDLVNFMAAIDGGEVIEFAADKQVAPLDFFKDYLAKQPKVVEFAEIAKETGAQNLDKNNSDEIAERAVIYKRNLENAGTFISFSTAVERVMEGKDAAVK